MMRKSRTGVGIQMALALLMPPKGKAAAPDGQPQPEGNPPDGAQPSPTAPPHLTGRWDFSRLFTVAADPEIVAEAGESVEKVQHLAHDAWRMTVKAAKQHQAAEGQTAQASAFKPKAMTYEEIRLWLQSFNAGPYALLKYEGDVPYKETRDYVPRVMKYYEQDLSSDYDDEINAAAAKYGLDPQMIRAIMKTESDFRNDCVSHAGARGLLQIMPVVWKDIKAKYELDWDYSTQVFEPQKNIEVGCAYLAWLRYDFLPRHFAAYDRHPDAPTVLVRDSDIGVPDRESPRLVAKSDTHTPRPEATAVASADVDVRKVVSDAEATAGSDAKGDAAQKSDKKEVASASSKSDSAAKEKSESSDKTDEKTDRKESAKAGDSAKKSSDSSDSGKKDVSAKAASDKTETKASKVVISDSRPAKSSDGKVRVVSRGSGKAVAISVGKGGKVTTREKSDSNDDEVRVRKQESIAKAKTPAREDRESQGG